MIKKKVISIMFMVAAFLMQTTVFRALELADVVPNLLLTVTVSYAYLRGRTSGILIGFVCGIMLDMMYGSVLGLYAFVMMSIGFFMGFCRKFYFTDRSLSLPAVLIAVSDLLYGNYIYITEFLMRGKLHFGFYFVHRILPEIIYTALVGVAVYRLIAALERLLTLPEKEA